MNIRGFVRAACVTAAGLATVAAATITPLAAADYAKYHTYDEMTAALRDLAKTHANLAKLVEVAKTHEGRTIWAIEIANPAGTPVAERPALLIAANFEGDQLIGSELALYVAEQLLTGYAGEPDDQAAARLARLLHRPARQRRTAPKRCSARSSRRARRTARRTTPTTTAALDEDGPEDLNKDGFIIGDAREGSEGRLHAASRRSAAAAPRRCGEGRGRRLLGLLGRASTTTATASSTRTAPAASISTATSSTSIPTTRPTPGRTWSSEPEARGMLDYVLARRNIAAILTFGESDNLIAPPTRSRRAGAGVDRRPGRLRQPRASTARGTTGRFQAPQGFGGRGFGGGGGGGDAARPRRRRRPRRPARRDAAGDDGRDDGRRVLPHDQRSLPPADRHPHGAGDADPGRRVLRVRLLPVRRAVVLDAGMGHRAAAPAAPGRRRAPAGEGRGARCAATRQGAAPAARRAAREADGRRSGGGRPPEATAGDGGVRPAAASAGWTPRRSTASSPGRRSSIRRSATSRSAASGRTR